MNKLRIYTDGGSRGNPGPAACAAVFQDSQGKTVYQLSKYLGSITNNQAEYQGVLFALKHLLEHQNDYSSITDVEFVLDSELVVKQLRGEYRIKHPDILPLAQNTFSLIKQLPFAITFTHVLRNQNSLADSLLNQELDSRIS